MYLTWLLCPTILALLLSLKLIFAPNVRTNASKFLGLFFMLLGIVLVAVTMVGLFTETAALATLVNSMSLLFYVAIIALPPTVYVYTTYLTKYDKQKINSATILPHYYISIALLLINLIALFYFLTTTAQLEEAYMYTLMTDVMTYSNFIALIFIFPITTIYYIYKSYGLYLKHKSIIAEFFSYEKGINLNWIKTFLVGYIIFIAFIYMTQFSGFQNLLILRSLFMFCYLAFIGYQGDRQLPILFEGAEEGVSRKEEEEEEKVLVPTLAPADNEGKTSSKPELVLAEKQSAKKSLEEERDQQIKAELLSYMITERPYLNSKLTMHQLSKSLKTNNKYLSSVINNGFNQNFVSFINTYRIEEAKRLLTNPEFENYTIEAIANKAGFHSKSTFNSAFKNTTGMTPSGFKKTGVVKVVRG